MREITVDELCDALPSLFRDTDRYLEMCNMFIQQHPDLPDGYYCRHRVWLWKGDWDKAVADADENLARDPRAFSYGARGEVFHRAGRYAEAIADFDRSEALDREEWLCGFGPIRRAECHARLGNLPMALADCADIEDEHWMPGINGIIPGDKDAVIAAVKRIAAEVGAAKGEGR
jgi:tetratricopeptide (TPR) repeat protein